MTNDDNKGIKLIKTFIKNMHYLYWKIKGKKSGMNNLNNTNEVCEIPDSRNCCAPSPK